MMLGNASRDRVRHVFTIALLVGGAGLLKVIRMTRRERSAVPAGAVIAAVALTLATLSAGVVPGDWRRVRVLSDEPDIVCEIGLGIFVTAGALVVVISSSLVILALDARTVRRASLGQMFGNWLGG